MNVNEIQNYDADESEFNGGEILPKYNVGEMVAVAQSYRDCGGINKDSRPNWDVIAEAKGASNAGWNKNISYTSCKWKL